ncbi:MAG: hypothetical protein P4L46_10555 [Fimbriimonas sp.]|nr:hypothetical protein [Fimbriimonas sp.]
MKILLLTGATLCLLLLGGCEQKDQDAALAQGRAAVNKATELAGSAWKSATDAASKLSADSGRAALESAKANLVGMQGKLAELKSKSGIDGLKLDAIKDQIKRLDAALNLQKIKSEIDAKVDDAKKAKDNAEKSVDDVKAKLDAADAEYRSLQKKLADAQAAFDDASQKVKDSTKKVEDAAHSVGL